MIISNHISHFKTKFDFNRYKIFNAYLTTFVVNLVQISAKHLSRSRITFSLMEASDGPTKLNGTYDDVWKR